MSTNVNPSDIMKQIKQDSGESGVLIKGTNYTINKLPALPAYLLGVEIMETLLPSLGSTADGVQNWEDIFPEYRAVFAQLAVHLVKGLRQLDKESVIGQLLEGATCDGEILDLNNGMRGKVSDLAFLIEFALKENFTDFFIEYIKERVSDLPTLIQSLIPSALTQEKS